MAKKKNEDENKGRVCLPMEESVARLQELSNQIPADLYLDQNEYTCAVLSEMSGICDTLNASLKAAKVMSEDLVGYS